LTTRRRVVVLSAVVGHVSNQLEPLEKLGFELINLPDPRQALDERQIIAALDRAWGVIAGGETYSRQVLESVRTLRVIARTGVGYDAIDVDAATELGVAVVTTPGANAEAVADFTVALILACLRRTIEADADVRSGRWRPRQPARDLFAATVGIVGFGKIGQAVTRRLRGFNCRILVVEPFPDDDALRTLGVELVTMEEVLSQADVLSLHVPLSAVTHHLIGERELGLMQKHAVVVNTSRGSVVDGSALAAALRDGVIAAAGLDVFEHEPLPAHHELMKAQGAVLSGHIASFTEGAVAEVVRTVVTSLIELAEDRVPAGCINPEVLKHR
jgi:D-3-phosphoglycerate dehydrogenase / 2-oxoglutarate reductase